MSEYDNKRPEDKRDVFDKAEDFNPVRTVEDHRSFGEPPPSDIPGIPDDQGPPDLNKDERDLKKLQDKDARYLNFGASPQDKKDIAQEQTDFNKYISDFKELQSDDRDFFKKQYDRVLAARDKGMDQLAMRKLLGMFMDSMSQYAAGRYGQDKGIDMTGIKGSPDWDFKGQQAEIDKKLSLHIDKLDKEHGQKRSDEKATFSAGLSVLDMIQQERRTERRLRMETAKYNNMLSRAKDQDTIQNLKAVIGAKQKQRQDTIDRREKMVADEIKKNETMNAKIRAANERINKNYKSEGDEEDTLAEKLNNYAEFDVLSPANVKKIIEDEGMLSAGSLKEYDEDLLTWRKEYNTVAKLNPGASPEQIRRGALQRLKAQKVSNNLTRILGGF